jgi:histidyl-tRNA synthetase
LEHEGIEPPAEPALRVWVVGVGDAGRARAHELVRAIRAAGVPADTSFEDRPLKAQLKMADRAGAAYAAIVGERELEADSITLRRLEDGAQEEVPAAGLVDRLAEGSSG